MTLPRPPLPLRQRLAALFEDPADRRLARWIFGTDSVDLIASRIERYCRQQLGAGVIGCEGVTQSVGAVAILVLETGEVVVLKAHSPDTTRQGACPSFEALQAVYGIQAQLAHSGFPCAQVLRPPEVWSYGSVAVMSYLDPGRPCDPHDPKVRRAMAETFADVVRLLAPLRGSPHLPVSLPPRTRLFPEPHNVLFDHHVPGGEWIDDLAREARGILDAGDHNLLLMHTDFSGANVRIDRGGVRAIYDMDSVAIADETSILAGVAVSFTYTAADDGWTWPTRAESIAFVDEYERRRRVPFTQAERERLDAAAIYSLAYTARSEHGADPQGKKLAGSAREHLREAPLRGYFDAGHDGV
jgi:hypothetical protein